IGVATQFMGGDDTLYVESGTYREGLIKLANLKKEVAIQPDGKRIAVSHWLTIKPAPGPEQNVHILGNLELSGSFIRLIGLDIQGGGVGSRGVFRPGIHADQFHHLVVAGCRIHGCGGDGIQISNCDFVLIMNNRIWQNGLRCPVPANGISISQPAEFDPREEDYFGFEIRDNHIFENRCQTPDTNGQFSSGSGIDLRDFVHRPLEQSDVVKWLEEWSPGSSIKHLPTYHRITLIENNLCYRNAGSGIHGDVACHVKIKNNTCVGNHGPLNTHGQISLISCFGCQVNNCISYTTEPKSWGFVERGSRGVSSDREMRNYWSNNLTWSKHLLEERLWWGVGVDEDLELADPQFQSITANNFKLGNGSPAIDAGLAWTDFRDYDMARKPRGSLGDGTVDLGALEHE
ncbi:MAG: right-handed parallel beta-helix repeat-containing protein, partial [Planctomycetota bacterium]